MMVDQGCAGVKGCDSRNDVREEIMPAVDDLVEIGIAYFREIPKAKEREVMCQRVENAQPRDADEQNIGQSVNGGCSEVPDTVHM